MSISKRSLGAPGLGRLVASAERARTLTAERQRVWELIEDPARLGEWWPGVVRVEGVREQGWTVVQATRRGRMVRLDFRLVDCDPLVRREWAQEVPGSPFERVLRESLTEVVLEPASNGTLVTLSQRQKLRGYARTGAVMLRGPMATRLSQALDGLARLLETPPDR